MTLNDLKQQIPVRFMTNKPPKLMSQRNSKNCKSQRNDESGNQSYQISEEPNNPDK